MTTPFVLALCATMIGTIGCAIAATSQPATTKPAGPQPKATIELRDAGKRVVFTVRVNTGGWAITTDRVDVAGDTARVFVTLTRPGPDEMVMQAFVTLTAERSLDTAVTSAELSIRTTVKCESPDALAYATVAKTQ